MSQENLHSDTQSEREISGEEIQEAAQRLVFSGFEGLKFDVDHGESEEALFTQITTGYIKAMRKIKEESGYDLSGLEMRFKKLPVRQPMTLIGIQIVDFEGEANWLGEDSAYQCGESTLDGRGIQKLNTVDSDKLADLIYDNLTNDREFLRLNDSST